MATQLFTFNTDKPVSGINPQGFYNAAHVSLLPNATTFDAFNRLRTSQLKVIFQGKHDLTDNAFLFETLTAGAGATTHLIAQAAYKLEVGTASGDRALRQSYEYIPYTAGNSHTSMFTCVMGAGSSASSQRVGLFDDNNGVFFELKNQAFGVVIRTNTSGSPVNSRVEQADFNIDKLDGKGPSRQTVDLTKAQIFHISYEWLGVGTVVFSLVIDGMIVPIHQVNNANNMAGVYMQTGSLPVRYEVVNTGTTTATDDFRMICSMVMSEGDSVEGGSIHTVSNGITAVNVGTTFEPVLSLRIDPNNPRIPIKPLNFNIFPTGKINIEWAVFFNSTLTNVSWTDAPSGHAEYDVSATALTGGERRLGGYVNDATPVQFDLDKINRRLAATIAGTPEHITIAARTFVATGDIVAAINYKELY